MEVGMGAMNFFMGSLVAIFFFSREYAGISIIILGVSDGIATIMGLKSKHKIYESKTFEGTIGFFTTCFLILFLTTTPFQAILISIILSVIELISPVDDNLLIPPACALLLSLT